MSPRILTLAGLVVAWIALSSCDTDPARTPSPTPFATTFRFQLSTPSPTRAIPTRVTVPVATVAPDASAHYTAVEMKSFSYSPSTLRARVGQPIHLEFHNNDFLRHHFAIDDSDVEVIVAPGSPQKVSFVFSKAGRYVFACTSTEEGNHRVAGMVGAFIVETAP